MKAFFYLNQQSEIHGENVVSVKVITMGNTSSHSNKREGLNIIEDARTKEFNLYLYLRTNQSEF